MRALFTFLIITIASETIKYSKMANTSPSVVLSFQSFGTFMTALLFYFVFKEKLSLKHLIGMSVIMIGVLIIGYSKSQGTQSDNSSQDS